VTLAVVTIVTMPPECASPLLRMPHYKVALQCAVYLAIGDMPWRCALKMHWTGDDANWLS